MAAVAEECSDIVIVTSDIVPRSEDPQEIARQVVQGFKHPQRHHVEIDRRAAIERAISLATPSQRHYPDSGKGHEAYQIFAHKTIEFDDAKIAALPLPSAGRCENAVKRFLLFFFLLSSAAPRSTAKSPRCLRLSSFRKRNPSPFLKATKELILVDAGHGGEDFGARSTTTPRYQEKNLTLATAKLLEKYLEQLGYAAIMTRSEDVFVPLDKRAKIANQLKPQLFVSVHYNSAPSAEAEGIEVYFYRSKEDPARTTQSRLLAQKILDKTLEHTSAKSRGTKHGNFLVIRETEMPAVLVEGGFLTNSGEMDRIKDPAYLKSSPGALQKAFKPI